MQHYE